MTTVQLDEVISGPRLRAAVVVAHPDDETLWCGGYILNHPEFHWRIVTLCRASDPDRAPKFRRVLQRLGAEGEHPIRTVPQSFAECYSDWGRRVSNRSGPCPKVSPSVTAIGGGMIAPLAAKLSVMSSNVEINNL